ncbi:hypothetical protein [Pseudomonas sp. NPDC089734]|uniref:hypothetical protein n=1 Tax=Pseudomonas sp. NPDC089734 TaxID=3364469 RepID=UPI003803826B
MDTEATFLPPAVLAATQASPSNPWRAPAAVLQQGKYGSLIIDRRELKKAVPASNSQYLFSETGAGVQTLVMIGTPLQIMAFLLAHQNQGIDNRIAALPDIYMGIAPFKPKNRFTGIFPIGDTLVRVVSYFSSTIPVPEWVTLVASPTSLEAMHASISGLSESQRQTGETLYVKFSYLPEDGMQKVGKKTLSFRQVLHAMQARYKKP